MTPAVLTSGMSVSVHAARILVAQALAATGRCAREDSVRENIIEFRTPVRYAETERSGIIELNWSHD